MRITSITVLLTMLAAASVAQDAKKERGFASIGINFSPELTWHSYRYRGANQWVEDLREGDEKGHRGFSLGLLIDYRINSAVTLETGLLYSNRSSKTACHDLEWAAADENLPLRSRTIYRFKYVSVPLQVKYTFWRADRLSFFAVGGISANMFLKQKTIVEMEYAHGGVREHASSKGTGYLSFYMGVSAGAGVAYQFGERFMVRAQPVYHRSLMSIVADREAKEYLSSLGMNVGLYYCFWN